jgi:hypothetical protein
MPRMSSVAKGSRFEAKVLKCFRRLIDSGQFFANPECCRIYPQKRYHSSDRGADITFDIAIEVWAPGADAYSLLVFIECKDYASSVPVGDVEQLFSRMQQVSGGNTKGIIVAKGSFQSSALSYAASKGIGVARCFEDAKLQWRLRRTPATWGFGRTDTTLLRDIIPALSSPDFVSAIYEFYCASGPRGTNSLAELLLDTVRTHLGSQADTLLRDVVDQELVPYCSREEIEHTVSELLQKVGYRDGRVPFEAICEQQRQATGLRCTERVPTADEIRRRELGSIDFERSLITVFDFGPLQMDRQRFTLAHELGHYFLKHGDILLSERCQTDDIDESEVLPRKSNGQFRRLEIQANQFASSLLLPARQFLRDMDGIRAEFGLRDKGCGLIYLDHQACNIRDYVVITDRLRRRYGASRTAVTYRLKDFGLLVEERRFALLGDSG